MTSDRPYQMCTRCIMDTSDPDIEFDENGVCNHCREYEAKAKQYLIPLPEREAALEKLVAEIKERGKGKEYDCIIGVSGGVDSTYVAYKVKKLGLRPLAVHLDNGWDSELAVSNIEKVLRRLEIDLYTNVLDWEEFKDIQVAFLRASVSDGEIPTDHAIWATLYQQAARLGIHYIILGTNITTEAIMPYSWTYGVRDGGYILDVCRKYGKRKPKTYPHFGLLKMLYYVLGKRIKIISILDYIDYNKADAVGVLENELGWRAYGGKHYESIYTRFYQGYLLPEKFNIDMRRPHASALIMSEQVSREEALAELTHPPYASHMVEEDIEYVLKKLGLSEAEFKEIMALPVKTHQDFATILPLINFAKKSNIISHLKQLGLLSN